MSHTVSAAFEFDVLPGATGRVELRESGMCQEVVLCVGSTEIPIVQSDRDQWGVWHTVNGGTLAQEDGTRSFLDAMIECLTLLKDHTECGTLAATNAAGG